jgi:hypothetical protein
MTPDMPMPETSRSPEPVVAAAPEAPEPVVPAVPEPLEPLVAAAPEGPAGPLFNQAPLPEQQPLAAPQPVVPVQPPIPGQPYTAQPVDLTQPAKKKRNKVPVIVAIVIAVLLVGGGVALALNFNNIMSAAGTSIVNKMSDGVENLLMNTRSGKIDLALYMDATPTSSSYSSSSSAQATLTYEWTYGSDLRSSSFWFYGDIDGEEGGIILVNDTLISYTPDVGNTYDIQTMPNFISNANSSFKSNYGATIDINKFIKDGKVDQGYIEEASKQLEGLSSDELSSALPAGDAEGMAKILQDFVNVESGKESVYSKFLVELTTSQGGGKETFKFKFVIKDYLAQLRLYAETLKDDAELGSASKSITEALAYARMIDEFIKPVEVTYALQDGVLSELDVMVSYADSGLVGMSIDVNASLRATLINANDLANNSAFNDIVKKAGDPDAVLADLTDII